MKTSRRRLITLLMIAVISCLVLGTLTCAFAADEAEEAYQSVLYGTLWSLLPPLVAIILALITKEVYSSLFIGIALGSALYAIGPSGFSFETFFTSIFFSDGGIVTNAADSGNMGILVFLVVLGIMVALMNKAGGSAAFGRWAASHIKNRTGAQLATMVLGILIFVDDYFNCLTVGSVMRPVTDGHKISRAKLSYLIDATAAPVCIIAPISSWAAAVTSYVPEESGINGFLMFLRTIPYNIYAILTLVMVATLALMNFDFGPMGTHERNAQKGDLFTTEGRPYGDDLEDTTDTKGSLLDLVIPVIVLIVACILALGYTGGLFEGVAFAEAFANSTASEGLVLGSVIALIFTFIWYMVRRTMSFRDFMDSFPEGFKAMVPAILILCFAWALGSTTKTNLGSTDFVKNALENAGMLANFMPLILFLIACGIAFSTGTSWGTFGIMIPIIVGVYPPESEMLIVAIAAAMGGAVMGDHCSPISDTTIMASAGGHCDHVNHVSTQLPYVLTCAAVCAVCYLIAAFLPEGSNWAILPIGIVLMIGTLFVIRSISAKKAPSGSK